jgi:lipopolysaccharide/colanic/teichoic acid biosynthesis glycosyltransferase
LRTGRLPDLSFVGFTAERYREEYCPDIAARYVGDISDLKEIVLEQAVDDLIVATPAAEGSVDTEHAVEVAANLGVRVWAVRQALGVPDYAVENNTADYIELVAAPTSSSIKSVAKRALDLALSASVLIVGFPFAAVMLLREKTRGHSICLDRQTRVGLHRHLFQIRRVHPNVDSDWLCQLMNKYLLMWNVFRGEMSMVGPSALSPEDLAGREIPEAVSRFGIRPGLTGGREFAADSDLQGSLGRGQDYAEQRPLASDLVVLFRAARAFVQRNTTTHLETGAL